MLRIDKIKPLIKKRGLKISEFPKRFGMTRQNFDHLIKTKRIKSELLQKIADELDVSVSYFYDEGNTLNESDEQYTVKKYDCLEEIDQINFLRQQLNEKSNHIKLLEEKIEKLQIDKSIYRPNK